MATQADVRQWRDTLEDALSVGLEPILSRQPVRVKRFISARADLVRAAVVVADSGLLVSAGQRVRYATALAHPGLPPLLHRDGGNKESNDRVEPPCPYKSVAE